MPTSLAAENCNPETPQDHAGRRIAVGVAAALVTACALWASARVHLGRACEADDTPYLQLCGSPRTPGGADRLARARARVAENIGDSRAWVDFANTRPEPLSNDLAAALAVLAPSDPNSLRLRARHSLLAGDTAAAVDSLVKMTEYGIGGNEPPHLLARILATPQGRDIVERQLDSAPGRRWVAAVLRSTADLKLPTDHALALLITAAAQGGLDDSTIAAFIGTLKEQGRWSDAYALWVAQKRRPVPTLFNGDFDTRFDPQGFDWEILSDQGGQPAIGYAIRNTENGHHALEIAFSGRAFLTPIVRQRMLLMPGRYILDGEFETVRLRSEAGLVWSLKCANHPGAPLGASAPLAASEGTWKSFSLQFLVPQDCGPYTSLELQPAAAYEAQAGIAGQISLRSLKMRRAPG